MGKSHPEISALERLKSISLLKIITILLLIAVVYLQSILWIGEGSVAEVSKLNQSLMEMELQNTQLKERNQKLIDEVDNLKNSLELIEYRARKDLGMIKEREVFYRIIDGRPQPLAEPLK